MSKKSLIITFILLVALCGGVLVWRVQNTRAKDAKIESEILKELTIEQINLVLKNEAPSGDSSVAGTDENAEARRDFLKGMREYLALAAEARREGLTEESNFKINFEFKKNILLADLYKTKLSREQGKYYIVPKEETDAVWTNAANEKQFQTDITTLQTIQKAVAAERGDNAVFSKLQGGSLVKARENWARTKILSDRAKADAEFISQTEVGLRIKIVEAGILSADYLRKHWAKNIKATEREISDYLAVHPEYDVRKKREKAETLLRRAQSGEDFSRLASEFSEDRTSKNKGGLFENVEKNTLWAEVETAALALEKNQIADRLIETETGFHIVKLENKQIKKEANGSETVKYSVRHILLQKNFEDPGNSNPDIPSPFLKAEEIAKAEIEKEKRNKFVESIVEHNKINLPDDFTVWSPAGTTEDTLRSASSSAIAVR